MSGSHEIYISYSFKLFFYLNSKGQFTHTSKVYTDDAIYKKGIYPFEVIGFMGFDNCMRTYNNIDSESLVIKTIDLISFRLLNVDTIRDKRTDFGYEMFIPSSKRDVIIGYKRLLVYNRIDKTIYRQDFDSVKFTAGYQLNDSIIVLSIIYSYHPGDGVSGINLATFNLNNHRIENIKRAFFPGTAMSHMGINWTFSSKDYFYAVTPMSGKIYKYDLKLNLMDSSDIPIAWSNKKSNVAFEKKADGILLRDWNRINNLYKKLGRDSINNNRSLISSDVFGKDFMSYVSDTVRAHYEYIEKVVPYNDSEVILSICKPDYHSQYRDILIYNFKENVIKKRYDKWQTYRKDTVNRFEDYFFASVIFNRKCPPYFHNNRVYTCTLYNPALYTTGSKDSLDVTIANDIKKNGYKWHLLEFQF